MNYAALSVLEAAQKEVTNAFITNIKLLDAGVAKSRLSYLLHCNNSDATALSIMGQFNSLMGHETSAD